MDKKINKDDWRLMGQEKYLQGVSLIWQKYKAYRADWDHDHCEFCGVKFMEQKYPDVLNEGYTTQDKYRWICKGCFNDFRGKFEWKV